MMKINEAYYEQDKINAISQLLVHKQEQLRIAVLEKDSLLYRKSYVDSRRDSFIFNIRLKIFIGICLGVIVGCITREYLIGAVIIFLVMLFQMLKYFKAITFVNNRPVNRYENEKKEIDILVNSNEQLIAVLEQEISKLEKQRARYEETERQQKEEIDKDKIEETEIDKQRFGFSLKEEEEFINKSELKKEIKTDISSIVVQIEKKYEQIAEYRDNINLIDILFKKSMKEMEILLLVIAIIEVVSRFFEEGFYYVLALCSLCITVYLIVLILTKYKKYIFNYLLEHNQDMFKGYAFCNDIESNKNKINVASEEINELKHMLELEQSRLDGLE